MKHLRILRGLPGSGRSFLANQMKEQEGAHVFSIDDFLQDWNEDKVIIAHEKIQRVVNRAMRQGLTPIVLDSFSIGLYSMAPYVRLAFYHQYEWSVINMNTAWALDLDELEKRNSHKMPRKVLEEMKEDLERIRLDVIVTSLKYETATDPESALRLAQIALESRKYGDVDCNLYDYQEWRRIGGYAPDSGDITAQKIQDKLSESKYFAE